MASHQNDVYLQDDFSEPMSAQHSFASTFDLNDPAKAAAEYSKIMHKHTQKQYEIASRRVYDNSSPVSFQSQSSAESDESTNSNGAPLR